MKILKGLYKLFNDTPARRSDYVGVTGSFLFPKSFCATRWIGNSDVAERAMEIWDNVLKIFKFWEGLPKHKRLSSKSYLIVQEATRGNIILAKLHFFASVANLKPFLTAYQTRDPVVPFSMMIVILSQEKLYPGLLNQLCWRKYWCNVVKN